MMARQLSAWILRQFEVFAAHPFSVHFWVFCAFYIGLYALLSIVDWPPTFHGPGILVSLLSLSLGLAVLWRFKEYHGRYFGITLASTALSLGNFALTLAGAALSQKISFLSLQREAFQPALEGGVLGGCVFSAFIGACGVQLAEQLNKLNAQKSRYQSLTRQQALLREALETFHQAQNKESVWNTLLKTALQMAHARSVCLLSTPNETRCADISVATKSLSAANKPFNSLPADTREKSLILPIQFEDQPLAYLKISQSQFPSRQKALLSILCRQAAIALNRLQDEASETNITLNDRFIQALTGNHDLGALITRENGELLFVNPAAEKMLGWKQSELLQQKERSPLSLISMPNEKGMEALLMRKDGGALPVFCITAPIPVGTNTQGKLYFFQDLSRQKHKENQLRLHAQRLEQNNQDLEHFVYLASHDLQAPLIKLQRFCGILSEKKLPDLESRDLARRIENSALRMQELIQNILILTNSPSSEKMSFETVDLNQLLNQVLHELDDKIHALNARVHVGQMVVVEGSPQLLSILLRNLLDNALKFHKPGKPPQVWVACQPAEPNLCYIRIKDDGIGFSAQQAERIFKMFERLHGQDQYQGSGIGLFLCKRIAEKHSGTISAYSELHRGATFTVQLPIRHW